MTKIEIETVEGKQIRVKPLEEKAEEKEIPKSDKKVITKPTSEEETWVCGTCGQTRIFRSKGTGKSFPKKCLKCGSPTMRLQEVAEIRAEIPQFDPKTLQPLVRMPFEIWNNKAADPGYDYNLTPAEAENLSANLAAVLNHYLPELLREHSELVLFVFAVAMVTAPRAVVYQTRKSKKKKKKEKPEDEEKEKVAESKEEILEEQKEIHEFKANQNEIQKAFK